MLFPCRNWLDKIKSCFFGMGKKKIDIFKYHKYKSLPFAFHKQNDMLI